MSNSFRFEHSRLKIERANRHVNEINSVFQSFLNTDFCKIHIEEDPNTGASLLKMDSLAALPVTIPLCIGDAAHNLRTSLDYVTTHIIGKDDHRITFPVSKKRHDLITSQSFRTVQKAAPKLANYILDEVTPYEGGQFKIWELSILDNFDKHKLLIPAVSIQQIGGICCEDENQNKFVDCTATVGEGGTLNMIQTSTKMKITSHGKPAAAILFPTGALFEGQPVIPALLELVQLTMKAIQSLETFCFGNVSNPNSVKR